MDLLKLMCNHEDSQKVKNFDLVTSHISLFEKTIIISINKLKEIKWCIDLLTYHDSIVEFPNYRNSLMDKNEFEKIYKIKDNLIKIPNLEYYRNPYCFKSDYDDVEIKQFTFSEIWIKCIDIINKNFIVFDEFKKFGCLEDLVRYISQVEFMQKLETKKYNFMEIHELFYMCSKQNIINDMNNPKCDLYSEKENEYCVECSSNNPEKCSSKCINWLEDNTCKCKICSNSCIMLLENGLNKNLNMICHSHMNQFIDHECNQGLSKDISDIIINNEN